jgi:hypothetical protein
MNTIGITPKCNAKEWFALALQYESHGNSQTNPRPTKPSHLGLFGAPLRDPSEPLRPSIPEKGALFSAPGNRKALFLSELWQIGDFALRLDSGLLL